MEHLMWRVKWNASANRRLKGKVDKCQYESKVSPKSTGQHLANNES